LAGVVSTARAGGAVASAGQNYELEAIAAVFIGGAAVQGGIGTIIGAVIGGLVMGVLNMGLSILSVDAAWQPSGVSCFSWPSLSIFSTSADQAEDEQRLQLILRGIG